MGFFDSIKNAAMDAARKAKEDKENLRERIKNEPLAEACFIILPEIRHARNIVRLVQSTDCIKWRIGLEEDINELQRAFEEVYQYAEFQNDNWALNMSQWIGARLYDEESSRLRSKENADGKRLYRPK